jgi:hypothetical protein
VVRDGDARRHPSSPKTRPAANTAQRSRYPPNENPTSCRRNDPVSRCTAAPGSVNPVLVSIDSAPPRVFGPNIGFDPGVRFTDRMAWVGIRSQFTVSPNGSFRRAPFRYTDIPCGVPSRGEARKPRYCKSGMSGFACTWLV